MNKVELKRSYRKLNLKAFGKFIEEQRLKKKLTMKKVAEVVGISVGALNNLEKNPASVSDSLVRKLLFFYGFKESYLAKFYFLDKDEMKKDIFDLENDILVLKQEIKEKKKLLNNLKTIEKNN